MKLFLAHSSAFDFKNEFYKPFKEFALQNEHTLFYPMDEEKMPHTKRQIQQSDVVIAEVSYPSTGQGIELGWADAANIPIICVYKKDMKFSNSLRMICEEFIVYSDGYDLLMKVQKRLMAPLRK